MGDLSFQLGYEYLTNWDYHPIRPKGIGYLTLNIPTGRSIYNSHDQWGLDSRGSGFWSLGMGSILTKTWRSFDFNMNGAIHLLLPQRIKSLNSTAYASPRGNLSLGGGYNFKKIRIGTIFDWNYQGPINLKGDNVSTGELKRVTTASFLLSFLLQNNQSLILSYADQTLLASPFNTTLSKSISLFFQKRWQR